MDNRLYGQILDWVKNPADNRQLIIQNLGLQVSTLYSDLKYYKPGPDPAWNKYLQQYIDHDGGGGLLFHFILSKMVVFSLDSLATLPYQWFQFSLFKIEGKDLHKCQTAYRPWKLNKRYVHLICWSVFQRGWITAGYFILFIIMSVTPNLIRNELLEITCKWQNHSFCQTNISPKHYMKLCKHQKWTLKD